MKGVISIIEGVMAVMIIMVGISMIYPIRARGEFDFTYASYNCLKLMDQEGYLRYYVENDITDDLNTSLKSCLPGIVEYTFNYCDSVNCNPDNVPGDRDVFVSSYFLSGHENYDSKLINLWVWLK